MDKAQKPLSQLPDIHQRITTKTFLEDVDFTTKDSIVKRRLEKCYAAPKVSPSKFQKNYSHIKSRLIKNRVDLDAKKEGI